LQLVTLTLTRRWGASNPGVSSLGSFAFTALIVFVAARFLSCETLGPEEAAAPAPATTATSRAAHSKLAATGARQAQPILIVPRIISKSSAKDFGR
jgi:hypothetical protein